MVELRYYQREAIDALYRWFEEHGTGNPLIVLPTGAGKALTMASFISEACQAFPETRVVSVTHVQELIEQNYKALLRIWDWAPAGVYSAGLKQKRIDTPIVFAGIQSIHKKAFDLQLCDLMLIDEVHTVPAKGQGMYRRFINEVRAINPWLKVIGFTATPYRTDSGRLDEGDDALFAGVAYEKSVLNMINEGFLSPVIPKRTDLQLDVSGVGTRGGDYIPGQLEKAVDLDETNRAAVSEIVTQGDGRKSWLIFCTGVDHANHVAEEIRSHGISCATITGKTPKGERAQIIRGYKAGEIRALTNANVLTTGFDAPNVDLIAMLRPTKSTGLYVQIVGRGLRLAPGKKDCLVLDFSGNTARHGPIDMVEPKKPGTGEGEAPTKECPECQTICFAGVRVCPNCGHEFPEPEPEIEETAATAAVLSTQIESQWLPVTGVSYSIHEKIGKPPSLRVDYRVGLSTHSEFIHFEGRIGFRGRQWWWGRMDPSVPVPATAAEALEICETGDVPAPKQIETKRNGKYFNVIAYDFEGQKGDLAA